MLDPDVNNHLPQRKHPVHMPPVERHNDPIIVLVTIGIQPRVPALANFRFMSAFRFACVDADAWNVGRFVIMPDHVHFFSSPARRPPVSIKRWTKYLKERITKRMKIRLGSASPSIVLESSKVLESESAASRDPNELIMEGEPACHAVASERRVAVSRVDPSRYDWKWQSDCWDTQMRSQDHYQQKWEYVRQNPVRKDLVNRVADWPWQGEMNLLRW